MPTDQQVEAIAQLIDQYERLSDADRRRYSETETRTNFIDRLFLALGWPVYDRAHVERETTVAEGKRPDYIFKLHGVPRLFLEAKPFREDIYDLAFARDAITKALNKGVPWAGVTNFAALVIFDAQEELRPGAPPARVLDLTYSDYLRPDSGLHYLTREALDQRLLEQQAQRTGTRPRGVPIEKRLYESMRQWRESLFNHMRTALGWKTDAQLHTGDEAIQRLIGRLMFLRNCEDRDIGTTDLRALLHRIRSRDRNVRATDSLLRLFAEAAATYDSELFQTEALIDVLLQGLATRTDVDDTLAEIVEGLYSVPRSYAQYDFAQMDADVLGQVYEQYLGYVPQYIRKLAAQEPLPGFPAREITVDAKRQRRKEHGIYYTPRWVVHYIVQQTLGRFLEDNRDNEEAVANLTILDPACGSGSFLIHAYETLLEHHAARMGGDVGHLDTRTREWILTHNILGVDLDPQAVEIARLNLLIRMVRQQELLPELKDNIRLGNSLISGSAAELQPHFGHRWHEKSPFNWEREFPQIMERGGFDIVIGNPPYVRLHKIPDAERDWFFQRFHTARNKCDLYGFFIERCASLLQEGGRLGFIVPNTWCALDSFEPLRNFMMRTFVIEEVSALENPFHESTVSPVILVLRKASAAQARARNLIVHKEFGLPAGPAMPQSLRATTEIPQDLLASAPRQVMNLCWTPQYDGLKQRIGSGSIPLGEVCILNFGIKTGDDSKFVVRKKGSEDDRPLLRGRNIHRYGFLWGGEYIRYLPDEMKKKPIARPGDRERFETPEKIILQGRSGRELIAAYDIGGYYTLGTTHLIRPRRPEFPLKYILALMNSKLMTFWYGSQFITSTQSENELADLPIRHIASLSGNDAAIPTRIITLTERMLDLHQRLAAKGDLRDQEREQIEREIAGADRQIDDLVYDLYGLTAAERALVEAEIKR